MSGIAGFWNLDKKPADREILQCMGSTLRHRGPDGCGTHLENDFALVFQNLWVTPESVGEKQPLVHPETGVVIAFDGRLDNREELPPLTPTLSPKGRGQGVIRTGPGTDLAPLQKNQREKANGARHPGGTRVALGWHVPGPVSTSDAQLALSAYLHRPEDFAARLKGDFAFAIFDPRKPVLILGRDPLGVRPLYYSRQNHVLTFGSEIKALLAHPAIRTSPDMEILADRLLNFAYDRERTFFKDICAVPPGHLINVHQGSITTREFWDFDPYQKSACRTFEDAREGFRHHLESAVRRRIRSARPVALAVSGGLDSSSIYCLADRLLRKETLCPRFEGFSWQMKDGSAHDEYAYVETLEGPDRPPVYPIPMAPVGPFESVERCVWMSENPLLDTHWGNTHNIMSRAAGRGARTFLMGLWADQLLNHQGYLVDLFRQGRWGRIYADLQAYDQWMPGIDMGWKVRMFLLLNLRYHLPQNWKPFLRRFWQKKYDRWYSASFRRLARKRWLERSRLVKKGISNHARQVYDQVRTGYMPMCLEWENKIKAHYGMDFACPFLDADLIQFLMSIPGEWVAWRGMPKGILRESMRGILPDAIRLRRGKAHFTFMSNRAMQADYLNIMDRLQAGRECEKRGVVSIGKFAYASPRLRKGLQSSSGGSAWALTNVFGLEMLLQVFFIESAESYFERPGSIPAVMEGVTR